MDRVLYKSGVEVPLHRENINIYRIMKVLKIIGFF